MEEASSSVCHGDHPCAFCRPSLASGDTQHYSSQHQSPAKPHLCCLLFYVPLLASFFMWYSLWVLVTVPSACCCTVPLWKENTLWPVPFSQQAHPHCRIGNLEAVSILREQLRQSHSGKENEKSETEAHSVSNINLM